MISHLLLTVDFWGSFLGSFNDCYFVSVLALQKLLQYLEAEQPAALQAAQTAAKAAAPLTAERARLAQQACDLHCSLV